MKFDIIVGNPPYGVDKKGSSRFLHLKIMNTALKFCTDKLVFIMPSKPITYQLNDEWYNMFKNAVCNRIDVVGKDVFKGTNMDNTAIYYCDRNDNSENYCKKFDVDKNIYYSIDNKEHRLLIDKLGDFEHIDIFLYWDDRSGEKYIEKIKDGYYLNVNCAGVKPGQGEVKWLSSILEKVGVLNKEEEIDELNKRNRINIIKCLNKEYGENLKNLMSNGLVLRYGLWLTQTNQGIYHPQFKYIPNLDYTNIHSDEELLSSCGFTPDEIEKTMDYLRHFDFSKNRNDVVRNYIGYEVDTDENK